MYSYSAQATSESTFIYEGAATTNYGTGVTLSVGEEGTADTRRILVRFPSLPDHIISVVTPKLYLYSVTETLASDRSIYVYRNKRAWVEGEATWNIYSTGNSWGTVGSDNASDYDSNSLGTVSISETIAANTEVEIDLDTTLLLAYLNDQATYPGGFMIKAAAGGGVWNPHSNDSGTSGYRPKLTFGYTKVQSNIVFI